MVALCAAITSSCRIGSAYELISSSRRSPVGRCSTTTSVILPDLIFTCTWTGPHRVITARPLTVTLPPAFVPDVADGFGAAVSGAVVSGTVVSRAVVSGTSESSGTTPSGAAPATTDEPVLGPDVLVW